MSIGEKIKEIRLASNLTQQEFAEKIGITRELLGQIERGAKEMSDATGVLLNSTVSEKNIPLSFRDQYKIGQNFGKVIDELRERGVTLRTLRDDIFQVKGSNLSSMYMGLKPVSEEIKNILKTKFNVNLKFIEKGQSPMFTDDSLIVKKNLGQYDHVKPYYRKTAISKAIKLILAQDTSDTASISIPDVDVDAYLDVFGDDGLSPKLNVGDIIGIKETEIKYVVYGRFYILLLDNDETWLRKIQKGQDDKNWLLSFENEKYQSNDFPVKKVKKIFQIKTIITSTTL